MEKKTYETPQLHCLGSVQELTALTTPCNGSALEDFPDAVCHVEEP
jgi:hypothetical protein